MLAPLDELAVVLALAMVPLEMLEALMEVKDAPLPLNVAVTIFAPKLPSASRATIVLALFAVLAVVLALARVPLDIFDALMAVKAMPLPDTEVNDPVVAVTLVELTSVAVMVLAVNDPLVSRKTMVFAPFDADAVVLALSKVPTEMLEALIATLAALVI